MAVPDDFPRRVLAGGLGGAALKFSARKTTGGGYSAFVSDEEHLQAYQNAAELVHELKGYALRKERENAAWTRQFNLNRIRAGIQSKVEAGEWDFTLDEQTWIMKQLTVLLDGCSQRER